MEQIKEELKDIDMDSFRKYFPYKRPDIMAQVLYDSKSKAVNYDKVNSIDGGFDYLGDNTKVIPASTDKKQIIKILNIVNKVLDFNEQKQKGKGLKILTPIKILSRLRISLAQLNAGNNSNKI